VQPLHPLCLNCLRLDERCGSQPAGENTRARDDCRHLFTTNREPADNVGVEVRSVRWNPPVERSVDITGGVAEGELGIRMSSENNRLDGQGEKRQLPKSVA